MYMFVRVCERVCMLMSLSVDTACVSLRMQVLEREHPILKLVNK